MKMKVKNDMRDQEVSKLNVRREGCMKIRMTGSMKSSSGK